MKQRRTGRLVSDEMVWQVWRVICQEPHLTREEIAYRLPKGRLGNTPSKSTVNYAVRDLVQRGAVQNDPMTARSIVIKAAIHNGNPYSVVWLDL